jgi:hypothetical protein
MGTPRALTPVDQMRNVQRTASCGETSVHECAREKENCRSNRTQCGAIALRVAAKVAFNSELGFLASGWEIGAPFFEVAQQVLFAQQPGLHAFCTAASERMQVRAERWSGAIVSAATAASEIAILLNIE